MNNTDAVRTSTLYSVGPPPVKNTGKRSRSAYMATSMTAVNVKIMVVVRIPERRPGSTGAAPPIVVTALKNCK